MRRYKYGYPHRKGRIGSWESNNRICLLYTSTWACTVGDKIEEYIDENLKMFDVLPERVTLNSALNKANENDMEALADSIIESMAKIREVKEKSANQ